MVIEDYLTKAQLSEILSRIEHGCKNAANIERAIRECSYAPYMENRKHQQTGIILSSFPPDPDAPIVGLTTIELPYGKSKFKYN